MILRSICGQRIHIGSREKPELGSFRVLKSKKKNNWRKNTVYKFLRVTLLAGISVLLIAGLACTTVETVEVPVEKVVE